MGKTPDAHIIELLHQVQGIADDLCDPMAVDAVIDMVTYALHVEWERGYAQACKDTRTVQLTLLDGESLF
jgi:hypothetical protein